jgi:hypothetical protein
MKTGKLFTSISLFVLFGLFATLSTGCWAVPEDRSTGSFIKEDRNVSNFSKLDIGGAFKVYLAQGDQEKLTIEADDNELKDIVTEVVGNTLKIYTKSDWNTRYHDMTIWITFKSLDHIDFSGAVEVTGEGTLNFGDLNMDVSGAAEIQMAIKAEKFDAEFSGASEVDFSGTCTKGYFELSGASDFDAQDLEFTELSIEVSGASEAKVWATGSLNIDASGASDIRYKGAPKISIDESGASSVKPL